MALTKFTRQRLEFGLGDHAAGKEVADVIDAGSGSLTAGTVNVIVFALVNRKAATKFVTAVNANSALDGYTQRHLMNAIGGTAMREIAAALIA